MNYPYTEIFEDQKWKQNVVIDDIEYYDDGTLNQFVFNKQIKLQVTNILQNSFLTRSEFSSKLKKLLSYFEKTDNFKNIIAELNDNKLKLYFKPKSRHYQHFSQNFNTNGNVSFGYEIGLRNIFKSLDKTSLKFDKDLGGGLTLDFVQSFPTQDILSRLRKVDYKIKIGLEQKSKFLSMDQKETGICFDDRFEIKFLQKRFVFNPLFFQQDRYEEFLDKQNFISLKSIIQQTKFQTDFFHDISSNISIELINTLGESNDFKLNNKITFKTLLRKIIPFKFIRSNYKLYKTEVENSLDINFLSNFQLKGYSIFNRPYYHNIRGFSNIYFNNPFQEQQINNKARYCLSLVNSLKINFLHFPIFQNSQVHPFFHNTTFFNRTNKNYLNTSCGVGLKFKMNEIISLEGMVNFYHYSNNKSIQNIEDVFQLRFSIHDQLITIIITNLIYK